MRWMVVAVVVIALVVGSAFAAEMPADEVAPAEEVASSTRVVRGQAALDASLAEGWRVVGRHDTPDGVVYELAWGGE